MFDEDADFSGHTAAGRPHCKDRRRSFKGGQKTKNGTFSEFRGKEPCWRGRNPQMCKDSHSHLFNIAGSKDSCGDDTLRVLSRSKAPRLYGSPLHKNDGSKAVEILRRFR